MKKSPRILIAGVGNIFLGDDAFGSEVAREMMRLDLPEDVAIADFGIRSYDLAFALVDRVETAILVDAVRRGEPPGTIYLIQPAVDGQQKAGEGIADAHDLDVVSVLQMARSLGGDMAEIYLIGCEPATLESEDGQLGLSEAVGAAVPKAIEMIQTLLRSLLSEKQSVQAN
jgi:hydrogenase maturation protease